MEYSLPFHLCFNQTVPGARLDTSVICMAVCRIYTMNIYISCPYNWQTDLLIRDLMYF